MNYMRAVSVMHRIVLFLLVTLVVSGNVFAGNATVTWNAVGDTDLAGYKIYYGTSPRGSATRPNGYSQIVTIPRNTLSNPSAPSYTFTNLTDNVTYYFAVTSYDDKSPANESAYSTEVSKLIVPTNVATNVRFAPRLDSSLSVTNRTFTISVYNPGSSTLIGEFTNTPDGSGNLTMPSSITLTSGASYDIRTHSPGFLRKRQQVTVSSNTTIQLTTQLPAGDLNNSGSISSLDWSLMSGNGVWGSADPVADIDRNLIVNAADFEFLSENWGLESDQ